MSHSAVGQFVERLENSLDLDVQPFLCRSVTVQRGIEWQAQYFASCLLMPVNKLEEAQRGRDLTNWKHLYAMTDELGVTISNLINRLKSLNWIVLYSGSKPIYLGQAAPEREERVLG